MDKRITLQKIAGFRSVSSMFDLKIMVKNIKKKRENKKQVQGNPPDSQGRTEGRTTGD